MKIAHLKDPELRNLAADLPLRTIEAKAPSTTERYSRAFKKFREWSSPYNEVVCLPSDEISVALYLESLIQGGSPYSSPEFLRYNELASLRCCNVSFCDSFVKIYVYKSKTDAYVLLARTGYVSCPFNLLRRYVSAAKLDLLSSLPFFRSLNFHKATSTFSLRRKGMSYSRTREIVLQAFVEFIWFTQFKGGRCFRRR